MNVSTGVESARQEIKPNSHVIFTRLLVQLHRPETYDVGDE